MERTAQDAYKEHMESIMESQWEIKKWFNRAVNKGDVDWGNVGDVTEVDTQLKQVMEFVKSIPQA